MIAKALEPHTHTDPLLRAGHDAEQQMAHYLKRAFGDDPRTLVFNNVRIERRSEVAQLDHLVLHRYGLVVIESKSVAGQLSVNERGEWTRWWNRQARGMASPVLQAQRQLDLLLALLTDHTAELLERGLFGLKQKTFSALRRDVLVAISDGGRITRKTDVPEVVKADQVPDRIRATVQEMSKRFGAAALTDAEMTRISAFLRAQHVPRVDSPTTPVSGTAGSCTAGAEAEVRHLNLTSDLRSEGKSHSRLSVSASDSFHPEALTASRTPAATPTCRQCGGGNVSVLYGKYGYYLKCATCGGNTPAKPHCPTCGQGARLTKRHLDFTATCPGGHHWHYFTNPG